MNTTSIEWTRSDDGSPGMTWNPVTGCTKVSPGCEHCYAETFAERWRGVPGHPFEQGFDLRLWSGRLNQPFSWRMPRKVFVNSMSDLFHDQVPDEFIAEVFATMAATPRHTYQILTKRPGRARSLLSNPDFTLLVFEADLGRRGHGAHAGSLRVDRIDQWRQDNWPLGNVWIGVSVESQKWAQVRLPLLAQTPAVVRFASCEPLLSDLDLRPWLGDGLDWVIAGGESGAQARPMHPDWARHLRDQCTDHRVAFFFKQWGMWAPPEALHPEARGRTGWLNTNGVLSPGPGLGYVRMVRAGKKTAGRLLDGRTWDQFPTGQIIRTE